MLTEARIREVLAALPDLLADAKAAGDEFLPVDRRPDTTRGEELMDVIAGPLAARMPDGERSVALIRDLHRIVEIHGFLVGAGSIDGMRERLADPAWTAVVAQQSPDQAAMISERARLMSDRLAQIPPAEEAAVRACGAEITATMLRLSRRGRGFNAR
jgi:hypothetical protein